MHWELLVTWDERVEIDARLSSFIEGNDPRPRHELVAEAIELVLKKPVADRWRAEHGGGLERPGLVDVVTVKHVGPVRFRAVTR